MTHEKMARLVEKLAAKTEAGEVSWEETNEEDVFQCSFPSYSVELASWPSREIQGERDFRLRILNENGYLVEEVLDYELSGELESSNKVINELFLGARRAAMSAEEAINSILDALE